jgi:hypothetical protein
MIKEEILFIYLTEREKGKQVPKLKAAKNSH